MTISNLTTTRKEFKRNFQIAGITIQVISDLPITQNTFASKFDIFRVTAPGEDRIQLHHHFTLPDLSRLSLQQQVYRQTPWAVFRDDGNWIYLGIAPEGHEPNLWCLAIFNHDLTQGHIYSPDERIFVQGNRQSLTLFPTDQILLAPVLADRGGCFFHASGIILHDHGLLFMGHSGAGKSTIIQLLENEGEILCDDRVIVRRWPEGFRVHGTWSHGEVPIVSNASSPLRAIFLLEQSTDNRITPIEDKRVIVRRLPFLVIKPMVTAEWWEKILDLVGHIAREVPVYRLQFDKSGEVRELITKLVG